jgi:hypothetical protein
MDPFLLANAGDSIQIKLRSGECVIYDVTTFGMFRYTFPPGSGVLCIDSWEVRGKTRYYPLTEIVSVEVEKKK